MNVEAYKADNEIKAFLAIERSLGSLAYDAIADHTEHQIKTIHSAIKAGDFAVARHDASHFSFTKAGTDIKDYGEIYFKSAYLLGASRVYGSLRRMPVAVHKRMPMWAINNMVHVHAGIVSHRADTLVRNRVAKLVDRTEESYHHNRFKSDVVRKAADSEVADALNAAVDGTARMMSSISANLSTSRLVAYGFLVEADAQAMVRYKLQATLDNRTSDICIALDGREFEVRQSLDYMNDVLRTTDPDALKDIAPFLKSSQEAIEELQNLSDEELQERGVMCPPFHPHCYSEGTRVFTTRGFVEFKDLKDEDQYLSIHPITRQTEWVKAVKRIVYQHKGKMLRLSNKQRSVSMLVTPDHTLFYDRRVDHHTQRRWETRFGVMQDIIGCENKLYVSADMDQTGCNKIGQWDAVRVCEFLGHYVAEGYSHRGRPTIVQWNPAKRAVMEENAKRIGFNEIKSWSDRFQVDVGLLMPVILDCGTGAANKCVPGVVFESCPKARRAFLDGFRLGDGTLRLQDCFGYQSIESVYTTSSPGLRDGIVRLLIGLGCSVSFDTVMPKEIAHWNGTYTAKNPQYVIHELSSKRRSAKLSEEEYDGVVYDVELERNHTLLIEYDGRIAWGSNCRTICVPGEGEIVTAEGDEISPEDIDDQDIDETNEAFAVGKKIYGSGHRLEDAIAGDASALIGELGEAEVGEVTVEDIHSLVEQLADEGVDIPSELEAQADTAEELSQDDLASLESQLEALKSDRVQSFDHTVISILKFNPHHDEKGKFSTGDVPADKTHSGPKAHEQAIASVQSAAQARGPDETEKAFAKRVVDKRPTPDSLPENYSAYFNTEKATHTVPLDKLISTKPAEENAKSAPNAAKRMMAATTGELSKRDPISVTAIADGRYKIEDGNGTYSAAKQFGWKQMPVQVVGQQDHAHQVPDYKVGFIAQPGQEATGTKNRWMMQSPNVLNIDRIIAHADQNQKELTDIIAEAVKGDKDVVEFKNPGVKSTTQAGRDRIDTKIAEGRFPSGVTDIVRAGVIMDKPGVKDRVMSALSKHYELIDEGWNKSGETGYFDSKALIRFPDGNIGELQFMERNLAAAKGEGGGHLLYEQSRTKAKGSVARAELVQKQRTLYGQAYMHLSPDWTGVVFNPL